MTRGKSADTRRQFIQRAGAGVVTGGLAALAGCTSSDNNDGGGGGGGGGGDGGGGDDDSSSNGSGGSSPSITIGGLFPTSGPYSAIGQDQRAGMEVAVQHLEEDGVDVDIETVVSDTQLDPEQGLRQARGLVQNENVDAMTGIGSSAVASAVANYATQSQVPLMVTTATAEAITGEDCNQYTFRSNTHTYQNQKPLAEWAMENLGTTFATMGADYSWGHASVDAFVNVAEQNGGEVVEQVWPKLGATDYSSQIQKVASTDADFLLVRTSGTDGINSAKQISSFGLKDQMDVITNNTTIVAQGAGEACIGNYGMVPYHPSLTSEQTGNEQNARFLSDFREVSEGNDPSTYACSSYMGVQFLARAAVDGGSTNADDLVSSLEGISYDGPKGPMEIRACDHQATNTVWPSRLVSPEGTDFDYPIPEILATSDAESNLRPCEETGCSL